MSARVPRQRVTRAARVHRERSSGRHTQPALLVARQQQRPGRLLWPEEAWQHLARTLRLSGRELDILRAVFDDQKESCIAANLEISTHTVHTHLERLYRKLDVSSRVTLILRVFFEYVSNQTT